MSKVEFNDLVFYEIYPTSFYDSNNDGVGDLKGISDKLDEVKELGCNAIWLNPFYLSPFYDGGYDVKDFFDVDPRFGNINDFISLTNKAHELGIKVIIDLVAGHASNENKEFLKSAEFEKNEYSDLFIWNDSPWEWNPNFRLMAGLYPREAAFLVNFFAMQPAFNYGFNNIDRPWQMSYKDERTFKARNYMIEVMRFWLNKGADGFRVDMADSLVKNDPNKEATIEVWNYMFNIIKKEFPNAYFVSEWSNPSQALKAGFDADFVLDHWDNFYHKMVRSNDNTRGLALFKGGQDINDVLNDMSNRFKAAKDNNAYLALISGNHDTPRIADSLNLEELKMFYLLLLTLPGTPFILYGDELEMKTYPHLSKDGGYQRTGTRIPYMWNDEVNFGFSKSKDIYLPFYKENKINLMSAKKDNNSLYNFIKRLIVLRHDIEDLRLKELNYFEKDRIITFDRGNYELILNVSNSYYPLDKEVIISSKYVKDNLLPPFSGVLVKK